MDDDRLDPVLVERFRELDDVMPPDTWPGGAVTRTSRARRWSVLAAAAALALIVGAAVVLRGGDEGSIVGAPVTIAATSGPSAPPTTFPSVSPTVYVVETALGSAEPAIVTRGQQIVITPAGAVERICLDIVDVFPAGDGAQIGQILDGATWRAVGDPASSPTWPACEGEFTDAPLNVTVPPVATGAYRFCIAWRARAEGCAVVTVVDGEAAIEPRATASPPVVVPGQLVSIAPVEAVRRACTDLVSVYAGTSYVGHVGGSRFSPSPGEGDSVPACEGDVSGHPIEVVVPPVVAGSYLFCVSDDLLPEGCAEVDVRPSALLATASSTEVSTGDVITITPSGVVPRICTALVVVSDATLATPLVRSSVDGSTQPFSAEVPACVPEPSDVPLTLTVPDLPLSAYAFCLSPDARGESCALVYVTAQRFVEPTVLPGSTAPSVGRSFEIEVGSHCGFIYLSHQVDGRSWMTDEAPDVFEWTPDEWADVIDPNSPESLVLQIVLSEDGSELTATANGRSVRYRPVTSDDPEFFCA